MKTYLMSGILLLLLSSCASFRGDKVPDDFRKLSVETFRELEGTYAFEPDYYYTKQGNVAYDDVENHRNNLFRYVSKEKVIRDTMSTYKVSLRVLTSEQLEFSLFKDDSLDARIVLGGKFKRGFFQLDNEMYDLRGIPFLFGSYSERKTRIGLSSQKDLLVYHAYGAGGGALIVLSNGRSHSSLKSYNRIL